MWESSEIQERVGELAVKDFRELKATLVIQDRLVARAQWASKVQPDRLDLQVIYSLLTCNLVGIGAMQ